MPSFAIVIPCYNEASRLPTQAFIAFAKANTDMQFIFVNDGSTDQTAQKLVEIQNDIPQTQIISFSANKGKAEAVRQGILTALQTNYSYIGYLDADLSTSLAEFYQLKQTAFEKDASVLLASRIKKADTNIERSFFRHIIGRSIATLIDQKFKLGVYDTQCGAKIFNPSLLQKAVAKPFYTKWFFDVEILLRIRKINYTYKVFEIPLTSWRNVKNSKLTVLSFPVIMKDLFVLFNKY